MIFLFIFLFELAVLFLLSHFFIKSLSKIIFRLTKNKTITINFLLLVFFPGVIVHELSHFLIANLLFVRTGEIKFVPEITEDGIRLGSVEIQKTDPIRRAIIGFSPVLMGLSILLMLTYYLTQSFVFFENIQVITVGKILLEIYLLFAIGNTMFSSKKDLEGTVELLIVILIISFALYVSGVRIPLEWMKSFLNDNTEEFIKKINLLILIPIGIDTVLYILSKLFTKKVTNY